MTQNDGFNRESLINARHNSKIRNLTLSSVQKFWKISIRCATVDGISWCICVDLIIDENHKSRFNQI